MPLQKLIQPGARGARTLVTLRAHLEEPNVVAGWRTPLGRLRVGWGADLVQFDQDLLQMEPDRLGRAKIRGVWVAGSKVHGKSL